MIARKPYPSDGSDGEWALVAPCPALARENAGQREHPLREVFDALRYVVRNGIPWRAMPNDLPPWAAVYQQAQRWSRAGCFEALAHDPRALLRVAAGREPAPSAAVPDSRAPRPTPESGHRAGAGYDGAKRKHGSKLHLAVDTPGHLPALHVTPAAADDRAEVGRLAQAVQDATGETIEVAFVDQGCTGGKPAQAADAHGIALEVVRLPEALARAAIPRRDGPQGGPKARLRAPAQEMGGRALLGLGHALPQARQRPRAPAHHPRRPARRRLRMPHAPSRRRPRQSP
jgi:transposase